MIAVTSDLGRVTTFAYIYKDFGLYCGDVRSRTSYNICKPAFKLSQTIAVTSDLGRVTTRCPTSLITSFFIAVTSDLGRVTTKLWMKVQ